MIKLFELSNGTNAKSSQIHNIELTAIQTHPSEGLYVLHANFTLQRRNADILHFNDKVCYSYSTRI